MNAKEYKTMCRIKVTRIAKFTTCSTLVILFWIAQYFEFGGYLTAAISTVLWLYLPDLTAYLLECKYKLTHDYQSYR